ncbi:MAG: ankyrin repeat domain-containing protein, partial [Terracidiphilus sp.]
HRTRDIERLLRRDPNALKPDGRWARLIVRAAECASADVIEALIVAGADVNINDNPGTSIDRTWGYTPLHSAAWHGNLGAIEVLMRHGANVTARETKYHGTPAGWADYSGHTEARDLILRGPIDIIEAIQFGLTERVGKILEEEPKALDRPFSAYTLFPLGAEAWYTPLAYSVVCGNSEMVRLLLDHGADRTVRSPEGETLLEIAVKREQSEVAALLGPAQRRKRMIPTPNNV